MPESEYTYQMRSIVPVSFIVGQFQELELCRRGLRYVGLSPSTKEKTPSFFVDDGKGAFHDFSCGNSGTVLSYLVHVKGMPGRVAAAFVEFHSGFVFVPPKYQRVRKKRRRTRRRGK